MTNPEIKVKRTRKTKKSSTDIQMLIESNTEQQYDVFDKQMIVNSITKECDMSEQEALSIANRVEETLLKSNFKNVSSSYIRSLVNQILGEQGYDAWIKYSSLSIPMYDVKQLIEEHNSENSNTGFSPESINLTLAGQILKQYALREVFDKEVSDAHLKGELHCHDLDFINRSYCSGNSIEYIKKYGLRLPNILAHSAPAKHALTLVNHISCFANYLQCYFAGAIGFSCVNAYFAPFLANMDYKSIKQVAQHLIYSFAQLAGSRGGQTAFVDFNVDLRIPNYLRNTKSIGPGGDYDGKTYAEYENEARLFLKAIFEVISEGDANKANFAFPKILLHITEADFEVNDELVDMACEINSKRGSIYILYDRGESVKVAQCCRLSLELSAADLNAIAEHPEDVRFSAWQNITINLPRVAYKSKDIHAAYKEIDRLMDLVMKGHINKYNYICKLLDKGKDGCLSFLAEGMDGKPYLRKNEAKFLVGMCGLNECIKKLTGNELHESEESFKEGIKLIAYMNKSMAKHAEKYNIVCLLEETPAEGTANRFALLDMKFFPESSKYIKGDIKTNYVYYTNSVHFAYNSNMDILTRIDKQSKFAPMIKAGSIIHNWMGENEPDPKSLKKLYEYTLKNTQATQTSDSPDITVCQSCQTTSKGLLTECPKCKSENVYNITKITGYMSKISGWTKGKLAELKDRVRVDFNMPKFETKEDNVKEQILFFSKPNCSKCDVVKAQLLTKPEVVEKLSIIDTQTYDGLAMASYYNVDKLPAILKVKGEQIISRLDQEGSFLKWVKENTK
jgi:ribonucleoside-triphosphate reductase